MAGRAASAGEHCEIRKFFRGGTFSGSEVDINCEEKETLSTTSEGTRQKEGRDLREVYTRYICYKNRLRDKQRGSYKGLRRIRDEVLDDDVMMLGLKRNDVFLEGFSKTVNQPKP